MRGMWRHRTDERGIASVMAIFIMVLMLVSGIFLVRMSSTEGDIAYGSMWAEGSFFAADAGINVGIDTVVPGGPTCVQATPQQLGSGFAYTVAAGTGADSNCFLTTSQRAGYSIGSGTGYNPGGFVFYNYAISGSGTGPRSAQRTIDAQVSFGPVAQ